MDVSCHCAFLRTMVTESLPTVCGETGDTVLGVAHGISVQSYVLPTLMCVVRRAYHGPWLMNSLLKIAL